LLSHSSSDMTGLFDRGVLLRVAVWLFEVNPGYGRRAPLAGVCGLDIVGEDVDLHNE
jgi:hypothetical protein